VDPPEELARLKLACQLGAALEGRCALVEASHLHQRLAPGQKEEDVRHDSENVRTGLRIRADEHERLIRNGQRLAQPSRQEVCVGEADAGGEPGPGLARLVGEPRSLFATLERFVEAAVPESDPSVGDDEPHE
jgi:hypothetical protein